MKPKCTPKVIKKLQGCTLLVTKGVVYLISSKSTSTFKTNYKRMKSEKEKMLSGEIYDANNDPTLLIERENTMSIIYIVEIIYSIILLQYC